MELRKNQKKHSEKYTVGIDKKTHDKIKELAFRNKTNQKEIIKKSIDVFSKISIFDNLV
jgi:hypothetical protein